MPRGKLQWVQLIIDTKAVEQIARIVSGEDSGTAGLDHARRIVEAVRALETNLPSAGRVLG
jgi:hypothetical protein